MSTASIIGLMAAASVTLAGGTANAEQGAVLPSEPVCRGVQADTTVPTELICKADSAVVTIPSEPAWHVHRVSKAEAASARSAKMPVLESLFGKQAENVARFNRIDSRFVYWGTRLRVPELPEGVTYSPMPLAYPASADKDEFILVALDVQFLGVYERGQLVASYPISSGKEDYLTPAGNFKVNRKCPDCKSSLYPEPDGGAPMPWGLRFLWSSYWIHGGDLVGGPASHGCVRMFAKDAEALYNRTPVGTAVKVVKSLADL